MSKIIYSLLVGIVVGALAFWGTAPVGANIEPPKNLPNHYKVILQDSSTKEGVAKPITLNQAWDITYQYALQWNSDAELIELFSSDARDKDVEKLMGLDGKESQGGHDLNEFQNDARYQGINMGQNGKRRAWVGVFQSRSNDSQLFVEVTDGEITQVVEDGIYTPTFVFKEKPHIDSPEAVEIVHSFKPSLRMAIGKGRGLIFDLQYSLEGKPEINVTGSVFDGKDFKNVFVKVDPLTGEILPSQGANNE